MTPSMCSPRHDVQTAHAAGQQPESAISATMAAVTQFQAYVRAYLSSLDHYHQPNNQPTAVPAAPPSDTGYVPPPWLAKGPAPRPLGFGLQPHDTPEPAKQGQTRQGGNETTQTTAVVVASNRPAPRRLLPSAAAVYWSRLAKTGGREVDISGLYDSLQAQTSTHLSPRVAQIPTAWGNTALSVTDQHKSGLPASRGRQQMVNRSSSSPDRATAFPRPATAPARPSIRTDPSTAGLTTIQPVSRLRLSQYEQQQTTASDRLQALGRLLWWRTMQPELYHREHTSQSDADIVMLFATPMKMPVETHCMVPHTDDDPTLSDSEVQLRPRRLQTSHRLYAYAASGWSWGSHYLKAGQEDNMAQTAVVVRQGGKGSPGRKKGTRGTGSTAMVVFDPTKAMTVAEAAEFVRIQDFGEQLKVAETRAKHLNEVQRARRQRQKAAMLRRLKRIVRDTHLHV